MLRKYIYARYSSAVYRNISDMYVCTTKHTCAPVNTTSRRRVVYQNQRTWYSIGRGQNKTQETWPRLDFILLEKGGALSANSSKMTPEFPIFLLISSFFLRPLLIQSDLRSVEKQHSARSHVSFCPGFVGSWSFSPQNVSDPSPRYLRGCFPLLQAPRHRKI